MAATRLFAADDLAESALPNDPWRESAVGDWVIYEKSTDGETEIAKYVRTDHLGDKIVLSIYKAEQGVFPEELTEWYANDEGFSPEETSEFSISKTQGTLEIDGVIYDCEISECVFNRGATAIEMRIWSHSGSGIPYRECWVAGRNIAMGPDVLRLDLKHSEEARREEITLAVKSFDAPLIIHGQSVMCIYEVGLSRFYDDKALVVDRKSQRWLSPEIPGGMAKQIVQGEHSSMGSYVHTMRVILFGTKDEPSPISVVKRAQDSAENPARGEVTLIGKGDTYVVVNSVTTNLRIPDAPRRLQAGEEVSFLRDGPIMIAASNIENLAVRIDGQVFNASGSGVRRWYFNEDGPYTPE